MSEEERVRRLRERLNERGLDLRQSAGAAPPGNLGQYMVFDPVTGGKLLGHRFDAALDDIEAWLESV